MATDDELRDLAERIARLSQRERVRVLNMALDVEDRLRKESQLELLQQIETLRELERQRAITNPTGAERAAG